MREHFAELVDAGLARCSRCGLPIEPGTPWDFGHDDIYFELHSGPEPAWNRAAANQLKTSRVW